MRIRKDRQAMTVAEILRVNVSGKRDFLNGRDFTYTLRKGPQQVKVVVNAVNGYEAIEMLAKELGCQVDDIGPQKPV